MAEKEGIDAKFTLDLGKLGMNGMRKFFAKYCVVLMLLIPIFLSVWFRAYPYYLPITDDWARNTVYSNIKGQISDQINANYPDLLQENKDILIEKELQKTLDENRDEIEKQIRQTSEYFKSKLRDERGHTYLCDIDAYTWYEQAKNILDYGTVGDKVVGVKTIQTQRDGRLGKVVSFSLTPVMHAYIFKIASIFDNGFSLMDGSFAFPIILVTLSVIPAFFIGRRIGGNVAGLFAGIIVAINSALLSRTTAGFADSDANQAFFPLLIMWAFVEMILAKEIKKKVIFAFLTGLAIALYSVAWAAGWWYIFDALFITLIAQLIYSVCMHRKEIKKGMHPAVKNDLIMLVAFFASSFVLCSLLMSYAYTGGISEFIGVGSDQFIDAFYGPIGFRVIKDVGSLSLWPNVFTTVAEFNAPPMKDIINSMGGNLLFIIALIGIASTFMKKDEHGKPDIKWIVLMTVWFAGSAYAFTKGSRFAILLTPAFAIVFGIGIAWIYKLSGRVLSEKMKINAIIAKTAVIAVLCLLLISPIKAAHDVAKYDIPGMNDEWYETLTSIKENSEDAIITSWWDFGHWFVAISDRRVTFDGGDQGRKIHWVGKALLTDNEEEAIGILRMLNCKQDKAYEKLHEYTNDTRKSVNIIYNVAVEEKLMARKILVENLGDEEKADEILEMTHCDDLIDNYFIASEDMIGKAAVWSHFGSWDFRRAEMYHAVKGKEQGEGTRILKERFGKTENEAFEIYHQIQDKKGDAWISSWYNYLSDFSDCNVLPDIIQCGNGLQFNRTTNEGFVITPEGKKYPEKFAYPIDENGTEALYEKKYSADTMQFGAALIKKEGGGFKSVFMDTPLTNSMFTRLFFHRGRGLEHFELVDEKTQFNGEKIYVYKVKF